MVPTNSTLIENMPDDVYALADELKRLSDSGGYLVIDKKYCAECRTDYLISLDGLCVMMGITVKIMIL